MCIFFLTARCRHVILASSMWRSSRHGAAVAASKKEGHTMSTSAPPIVWQSADTIITPVYVMRGTSPRMTHTPSSRQIDDGWAAIILHMARSRAIIGMTTAMIRQIIDASDGDTVRIGRHLIDEAIMRDVMLRSRWTSSTQITITIHDDAVTLSDMMTTATVMALGRAER